MDGMPGTRFWGKFNNSLQAPAFHPLGDHCVDVAAVTEALLMLPTIRRRIAAHGGLEDLDHIQAARLCVLAFFHDVGKLNIGFQSKIVPERGLSAGHVAEGAMLLSSDKLAAKFVQDIDWETMAGWAESEQGALGLLIAAMSHHGKPISLDVTGKPDIWAPRFGLDPFAELRRHLDLCRKAFPEAFLSGGRPLPSVPAFQHAYAGLVMLADWIGSDARTDLFPYTQPGDGDRLTFARDRARKALRAFGIDPSGALAALPRSASFKICFGYEPRPLQSAAGTVAATAPALSILEAETGSGKTEAALWYYFSLLRDRHVDGLYFALPTRAAATQIHRRINDFVRRVFGEAAPSPVLAIPGFIRAGDCDGTALPDFSVQWHDEPDAVERLRRWAAEHPKRFLAAQIAVGTIDQVLLSTLQVKHAHLRAHALQRSLLVVDEVHASDPYMHRLLSAVIDAHISCGGRALLLSATLGEARRRSFLDGGAPRSLEDAAKQPYPAISWTSHAPRIRAVGSSGRDKRIHLDWMPWGGERRALAARLAHRAAAAAKRGAKVLIIRNTVAEAVATMEHLVRDLGPQDPRLFRVNGVPTLHHARFAAEDRRLLDRAVEQSIGRDRPAGGVIVVGTQTVEQSLDIDADLLMTDICPMDVLLQRIGRLHRHVRGDRPEGFDVPRCVLLSPEIDELPAMIRRPRNGLGNVYPDLRVLRATIELLQGLSAIEIPAMNRELVESAVHPEVLARIGRQDETWNAHGQKMDGIALAQIGQAGLSLIRRDVPFDDRSVLFQDDLDRKIGTRLGLDDRRVLLPANTVGPFGTPITVLTLPGHMCVDVQTDAEPEAFRQVGSELFFTFGASSFRYGAFGLRK